MVKRTILLSGLALLVIVLSVLGYNGLKKEPDKISPYRIMPDRTSAVLAVNDYSRTIENLFKNNLMWQELLLDKEITIWTEKILLIDSLIRQQLNEDELEDLRVFISFHAVGDRIEHCVFIPINSDVNQLSLWFSAYTNSVSQYGLFEEVEISECEFKDDLLNKIYFCQLGGNYVLSTKADLIEDVIRTSKSKTSLFENLRFQKVEKTSGAFVDWNLFINYSDQNCLKLLGLNPKMLSESSIIWSDWTALDATVHPNLFLLNGFSSSNEDSYLNLFQKQKSQDIDAIEIIPQDVSLFFHFGLSNYKTYSKAKREYFKRIGKDKAYKERLQWIKENYQIDLENEFDQWISNEFGVMFLPMDDVEETDAKVAFFRLSDITKTLEVLENLEVENEESKASDIGQIPIEKLLDNFESILFEGLNKPYYTVLDKYLLMSSHKELLSNVRNAYLSANTLKKSEIYSDFSRNLSDQSNVYIYIHLEKGKKVYENILGDHTLDLFKDNPSFSQKFEQIGIQFKDGKKNMFYQHMAMNFNPKQRSQGNILWEVMLDSNLKMKPQIVYNHYSNSREIFVQDEANTIYLIDNKGNIIWKRQMKEKILSKVYQIDVYKNNKLQMLFSGESSIYLLDRKGRDVENFPVQLPAISTNDLKIIDYEKNREYRILIGVRGGEILNYDRFGKKIKGWEFKASGEIAYPIDYFHLNKKDYIITAGIEGRPYVLNRKGESRIKIDEKLPVFTGRNYTLELSNDINQCKYVTTDESGNVVKLKFNGEKEIINLDLISSNHMFLYDDINNDRKNDYILLDSNRLMVYEYNKEKLFEIELEGSDPAYLHMYRFDGGYGKVGFTDIESAQVYLYRDAGSLDNNFPLKGNGPFSITDLNKDGNQNLIVGLNKKLIVYNLK